MSITLVPFDSPIECMTIDTETTGLDPTTPVLCGILLRQRGEVATGVRRGPAELNKH